MTKKTTLREVLYSSQLRFVAIAVVGSLFAIFWIIVQRQVLIVELEASQSILKYTQNIQTGLQSSIAQFKSYLLLADDEKRRDHHRNWEEEIHSTVNQLIELLEKHESPETQKKLTQFAKELFYLESRQWWIEDIAKSPGRNGLLYLYATEAVPLNDQIMEMLSSMIDLERTHLPLARLSKDDDKHRKIIALLNDLRSLSQHFSNKILQITSRQFTENNIARIIDKKREVRNTIQELKLLGQYFTEDLALLFNAFEREQENYFVISSELIALSKFDSDEVLTAVSGFIEPKEQELIGFLNDIRAQWDSQYEIFKQRQLFWNIVLLISVALLLAVFSFYSLLQLRKLKKSVVKPIEDTTKAIENLVASHKIDLPETVNIKELDELVGAFAALSKTLLVAEDDLSSSQLYLTSVLNNITGAIVVANEDGVIILFNIGAQNMFGYSEEEALGKNVKILMSKEYQGEHHKYIEGTRLKVGISTVLGKDRDLLGLNKSGETFPVSVNLRSFTYGGKKAYVTLIREESERNAVQKKLLLAKESAEQANLAKTKFLADMSHDLRTPLNTINGFAQLLTMDSNTIPEHRQYAEDILDSGNFLLSMIEEILDFSRIESGKTEYHFSPVNAADLFRKCAAMALPLADEHKVKLSFVYPDNLDLGFYVDEKRALQAMFNLISNAIKYNRKGGQVKVYISPGLTKENRLRINVSDNGLGISEEYHARIFDPFSRVSNDRSMIKGAGIGLSITRRLVEDMGGAIDFESVKGEGSVFWFELPNAENIETSLPKPSLRNNGSALTGENTGIRSSKVQNKVSPNEVQVGPIEFDRLVKVIYVEDSLINRRLFEEMMSDYDNVEFYCSDNALDGLSLVREINPDVLISDIYMPERDGFWLLKAMRSEAKLSHIPIIALSATAMPEDVEKALKAGFDVYQTKPFDVNELLSNIKKLSSKF